MKCPDIPLSPKWVITPFNWYFDILYLYSTYFWRSKYKGKSTSQSKVFPLPLFNIITKTGHNEKSIFTLSASLNPLHVLQYNLFSPTKLATWP